MILGSASAEFLSGQWAQGKNGWFFPIDEIRFYTSERPDTINDATEAVTALNSLFKHSGTDLYASVVPIRARLYEDQLPGRIKLPPIIRNRYASALAAFKAGGVMAPDLNTLFQNSPDRLATYPLYLKGDHHWAGPGGLLAAQTVAKQITASGKVAQDDQVTSTVSWGTPKLSPKSPVAADGKPAAKTQSEMYRPIQVSNQEKSNSLLGNETFPIAVVGDSFSNGERDGVGLFAFPSLIEHFSQRRTFNAAEPGKGPWLPMLDYLKSSAYQDSRPKVLVWEMWEAFLSGDGQGYIPDDFLRQAGPLVLGKCQKPKPLALGKAVTLTPGDYLVLSGLNASQKSRLNYSRTQDQILDVTEGGQAFVFPQRFGVVTLAMNRESQPKSAGICTLPPAFVKTLAINGKTIDLARNHARNQVDIPGFYPSNDQLTSRWSLGPKSRVQFLSTASATGSVSLKINNLFPDQHVDVALNGKAVKSLNLPTGITKLDLPIAVQTGLNDLTFTVKQFRDANAATKKLVTDSRNLGLSFQRLAISAK
ncbi:hypothetical protein [Deinococcus sp.]|uniref:alginate O-acetyltransferase AlgX-related protein n=1 Tax=Deinococcus sp. TaxID=47478 RepID=UPI0025BBAC3C|nr:hypothetical protein [Deinococcus sp.]